MKNTLLIFCIMFLSFGIIYSEESIIPNAGQWPEKILAKASADGINVWVTGEGLIFDHYNIKPGLKSPGKFESNAHDTIIGCAYMLLFSSDNQRNKVINLNTNGEKPTVHNYFYDHKSNKAVSVKSYREITVDYQGFSLKLTIDNHKPRYDIILPPGYNPDNLKIEFKGEGCLDYSDNGSFKVVSGEEEYMHGGLKAFQKSGEQIMEVDCSPVISEGKHLSFKVGKFDETEELTIDPTVFSTFLGGKHAFCTSICINSDSNPVLTIKPYENNYFPDSLCRYNFPSDDKTTTICCFDAKGKYPIWVSYFGYTEFSDISCLKDKSLKLFGLCNDTVPVSNHAFCKQPNFGELNCQYYSCNLNHSGDSIYNGTYVNVLSGCNPIDEVEIDRNGNTYVLTYSGERDSLIFFKNAFRNVKKNKSEGVIVVLDSIGSNVLLSSYWNFGELSYGTGIFIDCGKSFFSGYYYDDMNSLYSKNFICELDVFEARLDDTCFIDIEYSSFLDIIKSEGEIACMGSTLNPNYPVTSGANEAEWSVSNFFITVFDSHTKEIIRSGTFPGWVVLYQNKSDFFKLSNGSYLLAGNIQDGKLDLTEDALTPYDINLGEYKGYMMVIKEDLSEIEYCTYFAAYGQQTKLGGVAVSDEYIAYACGTTDSPYYPLKDPYDDTPFDFPYYTGWLTAIDLSHITSVEDTKGIKANIFPNPAHPGSLVTLTLNDEFAGETRIELIDISGRVIQEEKLSLFGAIRQDIQYKLPSQIVPGAYFVRVSSGDNIIDFKIVVE